MADFALDANSLTIAMIVTNGLWVFLTYSLRRIIGPKHFDSALKVVTKRIKHPVKLHKLFKSQYLETEIQDSTQTPKFYPNYSVPLQLDEGKRYNGEGPIKEYIVPEGGLSNVDPMEREQPFFNALFRLGETNNKMRDIEEARLRKKYDDELVTKKHFNMGIVIVIIGIVISVALIYQVTAGLEGFQKTFDEYKPAIDAAIANLPRITGG